MDLRGSFNEVLKVGSSEEVAEINEFAVILVLNYLFC